jgi:hypothetical protein
MRSIFFQGLGGWARCLTAVGLAILSFPGCTGTTDEVPGDPGRTITISGRMTWEDGTPVTAFGDCAWYDYCAEVIITQGNRRAYPDEQGNYLIQAIANCTEGGSCLLAISYLVHCPIDGTDRQLSIPEPLVCTGVTQSRDVVFPDKVGCLGG